MALLIWTGLRINRYCSMADFPFFKMAAVRHLGFVKVGKFNFRPSSEAQYASSCQISRRSVEPFQRYGRFSIFRDGGRRHLGFWMFQIFKILGRSQGSNCVCVPILSKSLKPRLRYGDFSIFLHGGRPPSWICFTCVGTTREEYLVVFVTVQNLVVIGAIISIVCKF